jgi:hypothetical protein
MLNVGSSGGYGLSPKVISFKYLNLICRVECMAWLEIKYKTEKVLKKASV